MSAVECSVEGCGDRVIARGWCSMHYRRWWAHGDVGTAEPLRAGRPRKPLTSDDERHGTMNGYSNLGCRCDRCTAAWADYHYAYMNAKPERLEKQALSQRLRRAASERAS